MISQVHWFPLVVSCLSMLHCGMACMIGLLCCTRARVTWSRSAAIVQSLGTMPNASARGAATWSQIVGMGPCNVAFECL